MFEGGVIAPAIVLIILSRIILAAAREQKAKQKRQQGNATGTAMQRNSASSDRQSLRPAANNKGRSKGAGRSISAPAAMTTVGRGTFEGGGGFDSRGGTRKRIGLPKSNSTYVDAGISEGSFDVGGRPRKTPIGFDR